MNLLMTFEIVDFKSQTETLSVVENYWCQPGPVKNKFVDKLPSEFNNNNKATNDGENHERS
jgi:hypothetical protein